MQNGDTLYSIAKEFEVSLNELVELNTIQDPNNINIGQQLYIPNLEGYKGIIKKKIIQIGETYPDLLRQSQIDPKLFAKLNHLTSPDSIYLGSKIYILESEENQENITFTNLESGQSLFTIAIKNRLNPWLILNANHYSMINTIPGEFI